MGIFSSLALESTLVAAVVRQMKSMILVRLDCAIHHSVFSGDGSGRGLEAAFIVAKWHMLS